MVYVIRKRTLGLCWGLDIIFGFSAWTHLAHGMGVASSQPDAERFFLLVLRPTENPVTTSECISIDSCCRCLSVLLSAHVLGSW